MKSLRDLVKIPQRIHMGRLAEDYDGIGQYVMVSLSQSSVSAAYKARVAAGDFGGGRLFPKGTKVPVISIRGQLEVLLGNIVHREIIPLPPGVADFANGRFDSNFGVHSLASWGSIEDLYPNRVLFIFIHPGPDTDPDSISIACSGGKTAVSIPGSTVVHGSWGQKAFYVIDPTNSMTFVRSPNAGYCSFALYQNVDQVDPVLTLLTSEGSSDTADLPAFNGFNSLFAYNGAGGDPNETTGQTEFSPSDSQVFFNTSWGMSRGDGAPSWALTIAKIWTIIGISPRRA